MIVYLARNTQNGKGYVGKTKRDLAQRWKEHQYAARKGADQLLGKAILKHGAHAFELSILQECADEADLDAAERAWIVKLGTLGNGYNLTEGGDGVKGLKHSAETRARMSEARRGARNPNFGKKGWGRKGPHSEETKRKLSEAHKGSHHTAETKAKIGAATSIRKRKPVVQISEEGTVLNVYPSLQEAARVVGGQANKISEVLCGHRRTHKGYLWQYALEGGKTADRVEV